MWLLYAEAEYVVERSNRITAQNTTLFFLAMASAQGGKKAKKALDKHIARLTGEN